ncbi:transaldolase family protein, partial [Nocardia cyriacigeorgica]
YAEYQDVFDGGAHTSTYSHLAAMGANRQRPLWASTGVKNPEYSDTMYVTELVAPNTVNTLPEKTLEAVADHGEIRGDTVSGTAAAAQEVFDKLTAVGIDLDDVFAVLEREGVDKFEKSWEELLSATAQELSAAGGN